MRTGEGTLSLEKTFVGTREGSVRTEGEGKPSDPSWLQHPFDQFMPIFCKVKWNSSRCLSRKPEGSRWAAS